MLERGGSSSVDQNPPFPLLILPSHQSYQSEHWRTYRPALRQGKESLQSSAQGFGAGEAPSPPSPPLQPRRDEEGQGRGLLPLHQKQSTASQSRGSQATESQPRNLDSPQIAEGLLQLGEARIEVPRALSKTAWGHLSSPAALAVPVTRPRPFDRAPHFRSN